MCGIFAYSGTKKETAVHILEGLKTLEYRGYDSWGIAVKPIGKTTLLLEKHIGKIGEATTSLPSSQTGIGHTRWATHGGVTDQNAHPHTNSDGTIAVVHNGIVENYQELRTFLRKKGYNFVSETDSEVLAHQIDYLMQIEKKSFVESVMTCFRMITGSNAIVALSSQQSEIVACRNGSPLVAGIGNKEIVLASDVTAILPYTKKVHYLLDGECVHIKDSKIEIYQISDMRPVSLTTEIIEWSQEKVQKGGYPHYMLKEIFEQADTTANAVKINKATIQTIADVINTSQRILLIGCGTAYHCALLGSYFFAKRGKIAQAIAANEYGAFAPTIKNNTICIAVSQSGETADTLIAIKDAKTRGATIVSIINARGSTLERISDYVIPVHSGPEIAVVSTKAFIAQSAVLNALSLYPEHFPVVMFEKKLPKWLTAKLKEEVFSVAKNLIAAKGIFVIGKYTQFVAALEVALKIKEASYIHAEGFAAGELKHGVISLIEKGTPAIVLADDETKNDVLSSAMELKSRGATIIGIAPFNAPEFDVHIPTPNFGELTYIGNVIVGQLLGYALSVGRGCDPDKPRNLAKSVTVK